VRMEPLEHLFGVFRGCHRGLPFWVREMAVNDKAHAQQDRTGFSLLPSIPEASDRATQPSDRTGEIRLAAATADAAPPLRPSGRLGSPP
jgi:hypothetical protein